MKKLVKGVGINDADYKISIYEKYESGGSGGSRNYKLVWRCPFYVVWLNLLQRCYDEKFIERCPTYMDCTVCDEWFLFSNFRSWMEQQDWEGKELDKDLIVPGNRLYSPETCMFIPRQVNAFLVERVNGRETIPSGVVEYGKTSKFIAFCNNPFTKKREYLGIFETKQEARVAWKTHKHRLACELAELQDDLRIKELLISRYL